MAVTTINLSVDVQASYGIDLLTRQLTDYAKQLIATSKKEKKCKHHYQYETLCGIFNSKAAEEELVEEYLKEKYNI